MALGSEHSRIFDDLRRGDAGRANAAAGAAMFASVALVIPVLPIGCVGLIALSGSPEPCAIAILSLLPAGVMVWLHHALDERKRWAPLVTAVLAGLFGFVLTGIALYMMFAMSGRMINDGGAFACLSLFTLLYGVPGIAAIRAAVLAGRAYGPIQRLTAAPGRRFEVVAPGPSAPAHPLDAMPVVEAELADQPSDSDRGK